MDLIRSALENLNSTGATDPRQQLCPPNTSPLAYMTLLLKPLLLIYISSNPTISEPVLRALSSPSWLRLDKVSPYPFLNQPSPQPSIDLIISSTRLDHPRGIEITLSHITSYLCLIAITAYTTIFTNRFPKICGSSFSFLLANPLYVSLPTHQVVLDSTFSNSSHEVQVAYLTKTVYLLSQELDRLIRVREVLRSLLSSESKGGNGTGDSSTSAPTTPVATAATSTDEREGEVKTGDGTKSTPPMDYTRIRTLLRTTLSLIALTAFPATNGLSRLSDLDCRAHPDLRRYVNNAIYLDDPSNDPWTRYLLSVAYLLSVSSLERPCQSCAYCLGRLSSLTNSFFASIQDKYRIQLEQMITSGLAMGLPETMDVGLGQWTSIARWEMVVMLVSQLLKAQRAHPDILHDVLQSTHLEFTPLMNTLM